MILFMKKQLIWVFERRKFVHYWWSYILFSPECKELTSMLDPLLYRWGVPPVLIRCVHWTMQMWVLQTWIIAQGLATVMLSSQNSADYCTECIFPQTFLQETISGHNSIWIKTRYSSFNFYPSSYINPMLVQFENQCRWYGSYQMNS